MALRSYRELLVWQKAMDLVAECYRIGTLLPKTELYGLKSQIERAALSIPANIAEGHGREHLGDYLHHLSIANGSVAELETHLLIALRLSLVNEVDVARALDLSTEVSKMLAGLTKNLRRRVLTPNTSHLTPST